MKKASITLYNKKIREKMYIKNKEIVASKSKYREKAQINKVS